ncbi:U3 small nucleolar RNA-associated protein 14 A [Orchesella cincta]|uniref:U3 small nucleolar RNA-associated protein 14 A n=1 Tax=Orchesella cincta TaxID=48709 RepID=A0A1D2MGN3_ORCCI|nr:U3 small nucleolar RNA-associated protein 14 A [Orchesella cincta]
MKKNTTKQKFSAKKASTNGGGADKRRNKLDRSKQKQALKNGRKIMKARKERSDKSEEVEDINAFSNEEETQNEAAGQKQVLGIEDYDDFIAGSEECTAEVATEDGLDNTALIESIQAISSSNRRTFKRKEASKVVEEFGTVKRRVNVGDGGVNKFLESVKEVGETKTAEKVAKLISVAENSKSSKPKSVKTLDAPAERVTSEKVKRAVLYDNAKEEVSKWNSVVYHNRVAEQLVFPMSEDKKGFKKSRKGGAEFMPVTPLEEEIAKVLYGEEYVQRKKAEMAKDPEKTDIESYMLSVEEAMATHSEMAKLRAMQSYAMAKAKRQNKIKSKKYHRLLRKSKIKQQMKEFEELQTKDPEGALLKLEELEKSRVQERMSLKHRNTSKWAKMQAARAKYNKDSRIALSEQLKISRDLTQKVKESSDEEEEDMELPQLVKSSAENPWMLKPSLQENDKLQMYYTGYKKFWNEYNDQMQKQQQGTDKKSTEQTAKKDGDAGEIRDILVNDEEINTENISDVDDVPSNEWSGSQTRTSATDKKEAVGSTEKSMKVNPDNFLKITKSGSTIDPQFNAENSQAVDLLDDSEESDDESESRQRNLIAEAFEDDDVVNEFHKQKKEAIDDSKPQDIDNFLPGWGSWTGKDVVPEPRRRKRFIKKAKKGPPRKDARISHVIINEEVGDKVRMHQVKNVPFPFTRVKDFERTLRAPIGRTWMPEHAVKSLTAPKVITRLGATIKPISEDVLAKPKTKKFHVPNTIVRMAKVTSKR